MSDFDALTLAQLIVRNEYINFSSKEPFINTSSIYRFTNEDITAYFNHLEKKDKVLTVIGSGNQILNGILAGTRNFDCFDISIFPEYYLYLQIASILSLSKEDYLKYYFSEDREELFGDDLYEQISPNLTGKYKEFWDTLYMFDDGIDIYNSLLFRSDSCMKNHVIQLNPYLQDDNYEKLRNILKTEPVTLNPTTTDIIKTKFPQEYDLINLSNILSYYFPKDKLKSYVDFLKENFNLTESGEIINYFYKLDPPQIDEFNQLLTPNGYVESIGEKKLVIYKK